MRSGEEPRLDITLQQIEAVHVRGVLAGIAPGERAQVVLFGGGGGENEAPDVRNIEAVKGAFDIPNVLPGKYMLIVAVQTADQKVRMQRQTIKVGPAGLDNVRVDLQQRTLGGTTIRGVVRDVSPGKKPPLERMFLVLQSTKEEDDDDAFGSMFFSSGSMEVSQDDADMSAWGDSRMARVKPDGTFEFRHVKPGTYLVGAGGAGPELCDYFTKTVVVGGRDVSDSGFTVGAGGGVMTMDLTISANGGTIDGTVLDDKGKPAHDVSVVAVPTGARRKRYDLYVTGTTDQYGRFQLRGVSPGDYEVYAWDDVASRSRIWIPTSSSSSPRRRTR